MEAWWFKPLGHLTMSYDSFRWINRASLSRDSAACPRQNPCHVHSNDLAFSIRKTLPATREKKKKRKSETIKRGGVGCQCRSFLVIQFCCTLLKVLKIRIIWWLFTHRQSCEIQRKTSLNKNEKRKHSQSTAKLWNNRTPYYFTIDATK